MRAGFPQALQAGQFIIPTVIGKVSEFNAQGEDIPQKDLPKETVVHTVWRTWNDWHGYPHSGFVDHPFRRFPRKHIPAPSENFYALSFDGLSFLSTREIDLDIDGEETVLHLANMLLEYFGEFKIIDSKTGTLAGISLKRLQWEIFPKGKYPWDKAKTLVQKYTSTLDESSKRVVERRIEFITGYNPDFMAVGRGGFKGYFVYGFENKSIFVLESLHVGNATYAFGNEWEKLSKLTKSDIINGVQEHIRIIHGAKWFYQVKRLLS